MLTGCLGLGSKLRMKTARALIIVVGVILGVITLWAPISSLTMGRTFTEGQAMAGLVLGLVAAMLLTVGQDSLK